MPRSPQAQPNWTATRTHPAAPPPSRAAVAAPTIIRSIRAPAGSSLPKKLADSDRRPLAFKRGEAAQCKACKAWMAAPEDRRANAITCAQCYNTIWPPQHEELWHDHEQAPSLRQVRAGRTGRHQRTVGQQGTRVGARVVCANNRADGRERGVGDKPPALYASLGEL